MGGKAPAFQFYVRDWLSDPQLRMCSHSTRGIWIDLLCLMWEAPERGKIEGTPDQISRMVGSSNGEFQNFLNEANSTKFADVTICPSKVTITNRRMMREQKDRESARLRKQRQRSHAPCHAKVTPPSSSSSSSSKDLKSKEPPVGLPSKEEISESSEPKIIQDLQRVCEELRPSFAKVFAFKNAMLKKHKNPRAILHALVRCRIRAPDDPWAFCIKIMGVEDGNYNERDWRKSQETSPGRDQAVSRVSGASGQEPK